MCNINGAREDVKRASLFSLCKVRKLNVVFLQETHSKVENEPAWRREWDGEDFLPISCVTEEIIEGRLLKIQAVLENVKMTFLQELSC